MTEELLARARAWLEEDPDPVTREELQRCMQGCTETGDEAPLIERFAGPLEFGTAGLRAVVGAGESCMNRVIVARASWAVGTHLLAAFGDARERGVVLGCDARLSSASFSEEAACVFASLGIRVHLFAQAIPTPMVAYAVRHLQAAAGVVVTASHNPPQYNGYKVFWRNGAQIIPPTDGSIAALFCNAPAYKMLRSVELAAARQRGLIVSVPEAVTTNYVAGARALVPKPVLKLGSQPDLTLRIVYTPLHGVGGVWVLRLLGDAGFKNVCVEPSQFEPDGRFPTVAFPNPEEKGSMDRVLDLARAKQADLVLANDPDADRLAVAARTKQGEYVQLTGNEVGLLLAHYLLKSDPGERKLVINTIVSSPLLLRMAAAQHVRAEQTLTGFKWIANRAMDLEREENQRFILGYEEALGYSCGTLVRDKDGISAALVFSMMAATLKTTDRSVLDELEVIYRAYGYFASDQVNIVRPGVAGKAELDSLMARLRGAPPERIGTFEVTSRFDVLSSIRYAGKEEQPLPLPKSDVLGFDLSGGHRILVRPSGTEPKVKCYFDVYDSFAEGESLETVRGRAIVTLTQLKAELSTVLGV